MNEHVYAVGDLCKWCDAKGWQCLAICHGCGAKSCDKHHIHDDRGAHCLGCDGARYWPRPAAPEEKP